MIIIGSDHAGKEVKNKLIEYMYENRIEYADVTKIQEEQDDYPDVAQKIASNVLSVNSNLGIAICGTGIGMSIACNKIRGIRAALCTDQYMAEMSRKHNNANILCLGSRLEESINIENVIKIVRSFMDSFYEGGRHDKRILKLTKLEEINIEGGALNANSI
ncbi:MAG: ribose 5-phosphate isomerase B [Clostridia bacterium]